MKQENNAIQNEIDQMAIFHPKEEPNNLEDEWLSTNEWIETVSDFEMFSEQLQRVIDDLRQWKWAIFALHSGIQGMMILALNVGDGLSVLRKKDAERYLCWKKGDRSERVPRGKLLPFLDLYKNIKDDKSPMNRSPDTQHFVPKGTQDNSIKRLNHWRNEFMHFTPKLWIFNREDLPAMALDCLEIAEFLAWESGNITWYEHDLKKRLKIAFTSARKSLSDIEKEYNGGTS